MDFLVNIRFERLAELAQDARERVVDAERQAAARLAALGHLVRIWRVPGQAENWGLWHADDAAQLNTIIESLPAFAWMDHIQIIPLAEHPADPIRPIV